MAREGFQNGQQGELERPGARSVHAPPLTLGATPHRGACGLCASGCGLQGWIREGELVHLEGDPDSPVSQGALCIRGIASRGLPRHPDRILKPRVRHPGADHWEEVSWEEALESIAYRLYRIRDEGWEGSAHRAEGLAFMAGSDLSDEEVYLSRKLSTLLGVLAHDHEARLGPVVSNLALEATLGVGASSTPAQELTDSRLLLVLGGDPAGQDPMLFRRILEARAKGARLLVADFHLTRTAAQADEYLALRPGTLGALLGGLIHQTLEEERFDREFLSKKTDACFLLDPEFALLETGTPGLRERPDGFHEYDTSSWKYQLGPDGEPLVGSELETEGTVFWHLRRHFARYQLKLVESLTGLRSDQIVRVAELLGSVHPGAFVLGPGLTCQSSGVQQVRAAAILQLLLGGVGCAGGGLHPLAPSAGTRAGLDLGGIWESLPGGVPHPGPWQVTLEDYQKVHGREARERLSELLLAWFDSEISLDEAFRLLPRLAREARYPLSYLLDSMWRKELKMLVCLGANPVGGPLGGTPTRSALEKLDTLVVLDLFETETSQFWQAGARPEEIDTEVWLLPTASFLEKDVRFSRPDLTRIETSRLVSPPGEARPESKILADLFRGLRAHAEVEKRPRDRALLRANWPEPGDEISSIRSELEEIPPRWPGSSGPFHRSKTAFPGTPHGRARLFAAPRLPGSKASSLDRRTLPAPLDGPFPEHFEPVEGPQAGALREGHGVSPLVVDQIGGGGWNEALDQQFPHFLVVGDSLEAWGAGKLSSRLPLLREAFPGPLLEISSSMGRRLDIGTGDRVELTTLRGSIEVLAARTDRLRPLYCGGNFVEVLWLSSGFEGLGGIPLDVLEPNTSTPESGTCRAQIRLLEKARRET